MDETPGRDLFEAVLREAAKRDGLTPSDRALIDALIADPHLAAFAGVAEVAESVGSSPATVVRSARRLGFEGWAELQNVARAHIRSVPVSATARLRTPGAPTGEEASVALLRRWASGLPEVLRSGGFTQVAAVLADSARPVWILSGHEGDAAAALLLDRLRAIRPGVRGVEGSAMEAARVVSELAAGDALIVIDRMRHDAQTVRFVNDAVAAGVEVFGLLDTAAGPIAAKSSATLALPNLAIGPFDSYAPAIMLIEFLVARVAVELGRTAVDRLEALEATWDRWGLVAPE